MQDNWKELLEAITELKCEPWLGRADWVKVSQHLGLSRNVARKRYNRLRKWMEENNEPKAVDQILSSVDMDKWEINTLSLGNNNGKQRISATLRKKAEKLNIGETIVSAVSKFSPPGIVHPTNNQHSEYLLVPCMYDLHLEKATIDGDGIKQAVDRYIGALKSILSTVSGYKYPITKIMLPLGNDFGNFDHLTGGTTRGTPQQNTIQMEDAIQARIDLALGAVHLCASVASTDVIMIEGNHDVVSNWWLGKVVSAYFRNSVHVAVDDKMLPRKYYRFGKNLFMLTHELDKNPIALFATEAAKDWSDTSNREVHTGHLHSRMTNEEYGVMIRRFPSLSRADRWHNQKGYVGNKVGGIGLVYSRTRGIIAEYPFLYD